LLTSEFSVGYHRRSGVENFQVFLIKLASKSEHIRDGSSTNSVTSHKFKFNKFKRRKNFNDKRWLWNVL